LRWEGVLGVVKSERSNLIYEQEHTYVQEVKGRDGSRLTSPRHTTGRAVEGNGRMVENWQQSRRVRSRKNKSDKDGNQKVPVSSIFLYY
jgi:hypothetical protein